ncbi:hypothetical protein LSTR_LSTR013232 [Laodelphax striatellus]|uniref:Uncharacterized protein n=1 Tax=Laodelphax striatellus TaxID=195883 RepID=A0A482XN29_LAOST|nr:hypothetical protein LSTR_LSTR013232 [Laodelphax striatellus]
MTHVLTGVLAQKLIFAWIIRDVSKDLLAVLMMASSTTCMPGGQPLRSYVVSRSLQIVVVEHVHNNANWISYVTNGSGMHQYILLPDYQFGNSTWELRQFINEIEVCRLPR